MSVVFENPKWELGDLVSKTKGSNWTGRVVGYYSTVLTPRGYAVESLTEKGSVQIYPESALKEVTEPTELEQLRKERDELYTALENLHEMTSEPFEEDDYDAHCWLEVAKTVLRKYKKEK